MLGMGFASGGSHTTYAIDRGDGPVTPEGGECGESIADARDPDVRAAAVQWIVDRIIARPESEICAWIGAAGFSGPAEAGFKALFRPFLDRLAHSGKDVALFIANDAVSLLKAPPLNGSGIVTIVGTGSVVMGCHPRCHVGVLQRGGFEWLVSDEGSGVWMTLECIRVVLHDIQTRGSQGYNSPLLDRLCEYFRVDSRYLSTVDRQYLAFARADLLARSLSVNQPDSKKHIANFVYPVLFDLADVRPGQTHDPLAAEVLNRSVSIIAGHINEISRELAAHTADDARSRERIPVLVAGNIAKNTAYRTRLENAVSGCPSVASLQTIGDSAPLLAQLAHSYLDSPRGLQKAIRSSFDPLHAVSQLM